LHWPGTPQVSLLALPAVSPMYMIVLPLPMRTLMPRSTPLMICNSLCALSSV